MPEGNTTIQMQLWVERLRTGDSEARGQLLNYACARLRMLTRRMLRRFPKVHRWEETDDVLQNALIRLHRALGEAAPQSLRHFFNLAALQIRRELIDLAEHYFGPQGRARNHHSDPPGAAALENYCQDGSLEPASLAEWSEFHRQVELLPREQREVFNLLWYEELTQAEAAQILGLSEQAVYRRWRSAKISLYGALQGAPPGYGV